MICAIACITGSGVTEWAGSSVNLSQMLLVEKETVSCLRGTFDVSQMANNANLKLG